MCQGGRGVRSQNRRHTLALSMIARPRGVTRLQS